MLALLASPAFGMGVPNPINADSTLTPGNVVLSNSAQGAHDAATLPCANMPSRGGDLSGSAGSCSSTVVGIQGAAVSGVNGSGAAVLDHSPSILTPTAAGGITVTGPVGIQIGASDAVTYCWKSISFGGSSHTTWECGQTTVAVSTTATTIVTVPTRGCDAIVFGVDASSNRFTDKVLMGTNSVSPAYASLNSGTPASRTYTSAAAGVVNLAMGSGTYNVTVAVTCAGPR